MNTNKEIKMNFKRETKRCTLPKTYPDFKKMIEKCYGIKEDDILNYNISYTDEEEDKVLITSEFDFDQAMIFMTKQNLNILRINIDQLEGKEKVNFDEVKSKDFEFVDKAS